MTCRAKRREPEVKATTAFVTVLVESAMRTERIAVASETRPAAWSEAADAEVACASPNPAIAAVMGMAAWPKRACARAATTPTPPTREAKSSADLTLKARPLAGATPPGRTACQASATE